MQDDDDAWLSNTATNIDSQHKITFDRDNLIFILPLLYRTFREGIDNFWGRRTAAAAQIERVSPRPGQLQTAAEDDVEGGGRV